MYFVLNLKRLKYVLELNLSYLIGQTGLVGFFLFSSSLVFKMSLNLQGNILNTLIEMPQLQYPLGSSNEKELNGQLPSTPEMLTLLDIIINLY